MEIVTGTLYRSNLWWEILVCTGLLLEFVWAAWHDRKLWVGLHKTKVKVIKQVLLLDVFSILKRGVDEMMECHSWSRFLFIPEKGWKSKKIPKLLLKFLNSFLSTPIRTVLFPRDSFAHLLPTIKLLRYMKHCILVQISKTCYFSFCHPHIYYTLQHFSSKSSTTPLNWIFKIPKFWMTFRHVCES